MEVKCIPKKQLFSNYLNGYRVVSCNLAEPNDEVETNNWGNFTISGSNINSLKLNEVATLNIELDAKSKYPASYILTGYGGVSAEDGEINVDPRYELEILSRLMETRQAEYVNEAYPNFVSMVLNGREEELDYHNIYNVGAKRLPEYIQKVKDDSSNILYYPIATEAGIGSSEDVTKLRLAFANPDDLREALKSNPYHVYMDLVHFPFAKTDELVLKKHPELRDSQVRCEYGCLEILRQNELLGDTRLEANIMASEARKIIPESYHYMVKAVTESEVIHYDPETKYAAIRSTYEDEQCIAKALKERVNTKIPNFYPMNWEKFKEVDGFECTEEQTEILRIIANGGRTAILTGGGGCGKTSSVKALIRMLEDNYHSYTLLAPTGVAAKRMRESTGRPASTIHMFLACEGETAGEYVVVDECSMVGVDLLARLIKKIGDKPNIIFVCDEAQLASISCGNIVKDCIDSNIIPRANLTKVFRYGTQGLATIATDARFGKSKSLHNSFDDFKFIPISSDPIGQVLKEYGELLEQGYKKDEILILSPFNKGAKGTYEINKAIQARYNDNDYSFASYERKGIGKITFKVGDRILNTHNNYGMPCIDYDEDNEEVYGIMSCMNGDLGICRQVRGNAENPEIIIEFDNGLAAVKGADIGNLLLGYAISIHKSQGSQSKAVIVVIDEEHKSLLSRNLLYVALSRAQKTMTLIANEAVVADSLKVCQEMERDTYLCDMLKNPLDKSANP